MYDLYAWKKILSCDYNSLLSVIATFTWFDPKADFLVDFFPGAQKAFAFVLC